MQRPELLNRCVVVALLLVPTGCPRDDSEGDKSPGDAAFAMQVDSGQPGDAGGDLSGDSTNTAPPDATGGHEQGVLVDAATIDATEEDSDKEPACPLDASVDESTKPAGPVLASNQQIEVKSRVMKLPITKLATTVIVGSLAVMARGCGSASEDCDRILFGQKYDLLHKCLQGAEKLGCVSTAKECGDDETVAVGKNGQCYWFPTTCVPPGFNEVSFSSAPCAGITTAPCK
jgi:hypothetical protein